MIRFFTHSAAANAPTALLLACAPLAFPGTLASQGTSAAPPALRDALPEGTLFYVSAPDINQSIQEMKSMPLAKMWGEEEVQEFFEDLLAMVQEKFDEGLQEARQAHENGMLPFNPDELMKLRLHSASMAITHLSMGQGERGPEPDIGIAMHMDFGSTAAQWKELIMFGLNMMEAQSRGMLARETAQVGDVELITLVPPETNMSVNVAFVGNGVVMGTRQGEVKNVLANLTSGAKVLSATSAFNDTYRHLDLGGAEIESFMRLQPMIDFGMNVLEIAKQEERDLEFLDLKGVRRAISALGIDAITGIGSTSSYVNGKSVTKSFTGAPEAERRGLVANNAQPLNLDFLKWVPKEAASFSASRFDFGHIYSTLVDAMRAYDPDMADQMLGMLAQHEEQVGVSIKDDLLAALGDEFIMWSMPMAALGAAPETAILLKVRDQQKFLDSLTKLTELSNGVVELKKSERRKITVYSIKLELPRMRGMPFNPLDMFAPTFSFKNGYMVAGFSPGDVKRTFRRMDREDDDPSGDIRSNPEFSVYLDKMPGDNAKLMSVAFTDWKAEFEGFYQIIAGVGALVPIPEEIPVDLAMLPDAQTLTQHLYGGVSWSTIDKNGMHSQSIGPWGPEMLVVVAGLAAGIGGVVGSMRRGY